jgi:hypothetical protein
MHVRSGCRRRVDRRRAPCLRPCARPARESLRTCAARAAPAGRLTRGAWVVAVWTRTLWFSHALEVTSDLGRARVVNDQGFGRRKTRSPTVGRILGIIVIADMLPR